MKECSNQYVSIFSSVSIQVAIIFAFLTIFFFSYVSSVENTEFKDQLDFVIDNIYKRHELDIKNLIDKYSLNQDKKDLLKMQIYGMIDLEEDKLKKESKKESDDIKIKNSDIISNATFYVKIIGSISLVIVVSLFILMYNKYDCTLPLKTYAKEAIALLFFIFIVEILFLNMIVKNYITANPNYIKNKIAQAIINYIDNNNNKDG